MHGGDGGVCVLSKAVLSASQKLDESVSFTLCGAEAEIKAEFSKICADIVFNSERFSICDSKPQGNAINNISRLWRTAHDLSIIKCVLLQKDKKVCASFSAGDTGTLYSSALFLLGREAGIERAALAIAMPTISEKQTVLLDIGANAECSPRHLFHFGILGEKYYRKITKESKPKIGILNIGRETYKGTVAVREAAAMMKKEFGEQFFGFVEGNEIFDGKVDVIVCDGFCGNAILKTSESLYHFIQMKIQNLLPPEAIKKMQQFNSSSYGCAPILGLKGNVFKAHGNSSVEALSRAIIKAVESANI